MCPRSVGTSRATRALETGEAKLWMLLVGVNQYQDENLPPLRYSALDCQGLGDALAEATQGFPNQTVMIYHDFAAQIAELETVRASLRQIVREAQPQDTVLFYFSGHGVLQPNSQQAFLCLANTDKSNLNNTGLGVNELLDWLGNCTAHQQLIWLDACHSGGLTLRGAKDATSEATLLNPTPQLLEILRQRAAQSKGFYALLSCDQTQRSWEFPELGHGLFTYYLMQGLCGEAADSQGVVEADGLYKYVYHQTLQYIDKTNQQLRLINQLKRHRGETQFYPEYPLQVPKRIVEGVGELILGLKPQASKQKYFRRALAIDGLSDRQTALTATLSQVLRKSGDFQLEYFPPSGKSGLQIREAIQTCLHFATDVEMSDVTSNQPSSIKKGTTALLYLRGQIQTATEGEAWLVLGEGIRLSRSWLRQELRQSNTAQQIVVLDCPGATCLADWVEDLRLNSSQGQCLIAAAAPLESPKLFTQALLETMVAADRQVGLPVASWINQLQVKLAPMGIALHTWLSGVQGVIEILPGKVGSHLQEQEQPEIDRSTNPAFAEGEASFYSQLEEILTELVGPIAPTLIRSATASSPSQKELLANLTRHLSPQQRIEFEQQTSTLLKPFSVAIEGSDKQDTRLGELATGKFLELKQSSFATPITHARSPIFTLLSSEQFAHLEETLISLIGPIAPTLLQETVAQSHNLRELVDKLTLFLSPHQKIAFQQRIISWLGDRNNTPQTEISQALDELFLRQCEQHLAELIGPIATFLVQNALKSYPQISRDEFIEILSAEIPDSEKAFNFRLRLI